MTAVPLWSQPGARTYQVRHRTRYTYDDEVTASYGRAHLVPRDAAGQRCRESRLEIDPAPAHRSESTDFYGNRAVYFEVHAVHTALDVLAVSTIDVFRAPVDLSALDGVGWEQAVPFGRGQPTVDQVIGVQTIGAQTVGVPAPGVQAPGVYARGVPLRDVQTLDMVLGSRRTSGGPEVVAYAAMVFRPGRPLGEALRALIGQIHADFRYRGGATSVTTTLAEVLRKREGVCQDFAHLAVACLRSVGLPARYVSGYLETDPPPGRPRLQGADASHAWVSVLVPGAGWVDLDPTNDQPADARYVVTAWGRDYTDVPPLTGVIFTESTKSTLAVEVDVLRVDVPPVGPDPMPGPPFSAPDN